MKTNPKHNLPHWIWYTTMFLYQADKARENSPGKTIDEIYSHFLSKFNVPTTFQLRNQGLTLMCAYGLLVLPRELWSRENLPSFPFRTKRNFRFLVNDVDAKSKPHQFIRCMRNAISHSNIEIVAPASNNQIDAFTFWNISRGQIDFKVQTSWIGLSEFIDEIAKYYINDIRPIIIDEK